MVNSPFEIDLKQKSICFIVPFVIFYTFVLQSPIIMVLSLLFLSLIAAYEFNKFGVPKNVLKIYIIISFTCFIGLFKTSHDLSKFFYFFQELLIFTFCYYISRFGHYYLKFLGWLLVTFILLSYYVLIANFDKPEPLSHFIEGSSQNGIPSYLLVLLVSYYFLTVLFKGKMPIFPAILSLVISFYGVGRGSMVVSLALIFLCVVHYFFFSTSKDGLRRFLVIASIISAIVVLFVNFEFIYDFIVSGTKLSVGLQDENRIGIFKSYMDSLNVAEYVSGGGYDDNIVGPVYHGNPHIAFIRLHAFLGLIPLVLVILSPIILLYRFKPLNFVLLALIGLMLMRSMSEPVMFPTFLDFFYFMCLFVYVRTKITCEV